jgi:trehalose 6-phosphate synthase/trehalose 6-phosphate phosphatase
MTDAWADNSPDNSPIGALLSRVAAAPASALLLDFDGTLAPFRVDPASVRPWAGVRELLEQIRGTGRTTIAVLTGRPAGEIVPLLGMSPPPVVWGLNGAERLDATGRVERQPLAVEDRMDLVAALELLQFANLDERIRIERKWNAIAVHWRGVDEGRMRTSRTRVMELFRNSSWVAGMRTMPFDGGVELRTGRNKGDVVRLILRSLAPDTPVACLGDDETDEGAFRAVSEAGLGILVRREPRPSAARAWLRPPEELRRFFTSWLHALDPERAHSPIQATPGSAAIADPVAHEGATAGFRSAHGRKRAPERAAGGKQPVRI